MTINYPTNDDSQETGEITALKLEKDTLTQQVKRLIKAEGNLYKYQEELDAQLKEYKDLYELSRKIYATLDIRRIFEHTIQYVINNLEYERVLFFQPEEDLGGYTVCAIDGYYDGQEKDNVAGLTIFQDDPLLLPLLAGREYLICKTDSDDKDVQEYRARFLMSEYLIYPLGSRERPLALLVVGNSPENAEFHRRVSDDETALLGMGNLVGLLSSAVENHFLYADRKNALEHERLAEEKYRGIFENALEGILQTTPEGRFLSCNPATAAILGYSSPAELIESIPTIAQLYVSPQRRQEMYALLRKKRDVKNFEVEMYRKDGGKQWVLVSTRPIFNEMDEIIYVDGIIQDISERKRAEDAIQELNEELEQRVIDRTKELVATNLDLRDVTSQLESAYSELKATQSRMLQQEKMASIGQLAAGVAHEINNPMGFIISNLNSLKKYIDKVTGFIKIQSESVERLSGNGVIHDILKDLNEQKKSLKIDYILGDLDNLIKESLDGAERVKKIVQELKSFSRLDESDIKMADINEGLESTINIIWNELKYNTTVKKEYGNIPQANCNLGQLNQVFMNILVNAAHAIESQGEITVRTSSDEDNIYISISDTGTGIPADKLNRIFEPFYTTKEVGKGTGLGLSIAYDIVKKHNGEIRLESEVGKGTTFTIIVPISQG
ncbi:MAG: hypothetical protein A2X79_07470 [Desulfuromonadaceae bacterium GWB2_53_15]|nr:MAG: hypothetical protein A2X83_07500 [Desulfuromonadales bacterium GWD2_54_10]OHB32935.1 MAG: hypothetical protein A2X79_07470 [Desulfuromonadaceae bacterium GWB2_53_15]